MTRRVATRGIAVFVFGAGAAVGLAAVGAHAQPYPAKPVRVVVPTAPGGGVDILARTVGQKLAEALGQQFVIDNRGGAGGTIGTTLVAKAPPDGYTLLMAPAALTISASLYARLPYDTVKELAPVSLIAATPYFLVAHPSVPAKSMQELIRLAKARPGQLNYASAGSGTASHLAVEMFRTMTGTEMVHVPYKGIGPAVADLLAGHVSLMIVGMPAALPHVQAGKLKVLATANARRSPLMPALSTIAESGVPGYDVDNWVGMLAPAGTPQDIVARLHGEIVKMLAQPEMKERLTAQGFEIVGSTPEQFAAQIRSEIVKWAKVVKDVGVRVD